MLVESVTALLQDFGRDYTVTRLNRAAYDPATGTVTRDPPTTDAPGAYGIRGVFINYEDKYVDGTVIQRGDRRLLIRASDAGEEPRIGDVVDGLQILDVRAIAPNGIAIAWSCQTRK
jgi:hypothetical protein